MHSGPNVKRISSEAYEDRLIDIFTAQHYDQQCPEYERDPIRETHSGARLVGTDCHRDDEWNQLKVAVAAMALADWAEFWCKEKSKGSIGGYGFHDNALEKFLKESDVTGPVFQDLKDRFASLSYSELRRLRNKLESLAHPYGRR